VIPKPGGDEVADLEVRISHIRKLCDDFDVASETAEAQRVLLQQITEDRDALYKALTKKAR
jgi:hypothetical protein